MGEGLTRQNSLLNLRGVGNHPKQAEFLLLRLLVSHYRQSLDGLVIFQDIYGFPPQNNLEQTIATNLAGIRSKYLTVPEPNSCDLRGFGLMGIYLLTGVLPGQLRLSRETGEIFWYPYAAEVNPEIVDLLDRALSCSQFDRFLTGQGILNTLQSRLSTPVVASLQRPQGSQTSQTSQTSQASPEFPLGSPQNSEYSSSPASPWLKPLILGNVFVGTAIALGFLLPRQLWQPQPVKQSGVDPANLKSPKLSTSPSQSPPITVPHTAPSLKAPHPEDPAFAQAIATAQKAVTLGQAPANQRQWAEITYLWQQAIQQMQGIPATNPNYATAQQKVLEYQGYLKDTQKQFDPFMMGFQQANIAVQLGRKAQSPEQWQPVGKYWQQAIQQMQAVPPTHQNYLAAQAKVKEYQRYQAAVQGKLLAQPAQLSSKLSAQLPDSSRKLTLLRTIQGDISPKSIVYGGAGLFFAQNMMYHHTITVYDRNFQLVKTLNDDVKLADYGHKGYGGTYQGSPVEAAFSHQGKYGWVSNYQMYGAGFNHPGEDVCAPGAKYDPSFVYRIDTGSLQIDRAIKVGAVPKYVAVSPDDRYVLVSNWCSWDLSIIDTQKSQEVQRLYLGAYPRGIAIDSKSQRAYIAVMGSMDVAVVNLQNLSLSWLAGIGNAPRHVNISPDDQYLYVSFNGEGRVGKVDLKTGKILAKVATGRSPRSMVLSPDGEFLYVVNYDSQSFSKVRTQTMEVVETVTVGADPIGITYDPDTNQVWVACYSGSIWVFQD